MPRSKAWAKRCQTCQDLRPDPRRSPVRAWESTRAPGSRLHVTFAGPFQGQILFILADSYTKWLEVVRVASTSTPDIKALRLIFATHGLPDTVVTDNGTAFTSDEFQQFLQGNFIWHIRSTTFHLAMNGQAERMVCTTKVRQVS